jgi:hypothetical protein
MDYIKPPIITNSQGESQEAPLDICSLKINELITEANESQNREKQVREAILKLAYTHSDTEMFEKINKILNSTKE